MTAIPCPHCDRVNTEETYVGRGTCRSPTNGDLSLCFQCGSLSMYRGGATGLRKLTEGEWDEVIRGPQGDDIRLALKTWSDLREEAG